MKRLWLSLCITVLTSFIPLHAAEPGDAILGTWNTTDNKSQVQISKEHGKYFAKFISLREPNWPADDDQGMAGKPKNDRKNPKPEMRQRPIVGIQFMTGFMYVGKNVWGDGKIYDPESGNTYKCKMSLVATNKLEVRGYLGFSLLGRTVTWTR